MSERELFGTLPDGSPVERITLRRDGLSAHVLTLGATVQDLLLQGTGTAGEVGILLDGTAAPGLTGITRPPDVLILNDPFGLAMMAGLIVKEIPFLFLMTLAAMPQVRAVANQRVATALGYGRMAGFLLVLAAALAWLVRRRRDMNEKGARS